MSTASAPGPKEAAVTRKKSTLNRITEMITKSPILEPLRSENSFFFFILHTKAFFFVSLPLTFVLITGLKFRSLIKDRPQRQTKLKSSASNASDCAHEPVEKKTKTMLLSRGVNIADSLEKLEVLNSLRFFFVKLFPYNSNIIFLKHLNDKKG
jgi:hypothetical protein